ncbi:MULTISPECIES: hypothetical protein [Clostridium]|uniref:hypothetical protein n=1 Tax=Clostridium TaxID=1485 RepID=UPI0012FE1D57|nr:MULTISPECIES: hypothetical protein [Clostridium]
MNKKDLMEMELDLDFELGTELTDNEKINIVGGYGDSTHSAAHTYSSYCTGDTWCY